MSVSKHIRNFGMFMLKKKAWWITPIVMLFAIIGLLFFLTQSSVVHPFIYAMF